MKIVRTSKAIRYNTTLIPSSCISFSCILRVCGCVLCLFLFCLYICVYVYRQILYICVCVCRQIQGPLRECCSIRSGASRLPYYCAPLVCVPDVIGSPAVWQQNKPKTKKPGRNDSCVIPNQKKKDSARGRRNFLVRRGSTVCVEVDSRWMS